MSFSTSSRAAVTLIATLLLTIAGSTAGVAEETTPKIAPQADKRMQDMSRYLSELKRFSVDADHSLELQIEGQEKQSRSDQRHVLLEQPNRLSVTPSDDGEGTVVCDGKQLFAYWPSGERYLLNEAPGTFADVLQQEAALLLGAGRTPVQYATGDWYKRAASEAESIALLEPETIDGVACDRIEILQSGMKFTLWIEQGDRPLPRKLLVERQLEEPDAKVDGPTQTLAYSNWNVEPEVTAESFAIVVPEDAEHVETLRTEEDPETAGPHPLLGAKAPDCELTLLDGAAQKLSDFKEKKVVVLDFWALWCGPCIAALPTVDQVATKFADRDVAFFAVNLGDEADAIREFLEKEKLKLPVAVAGESELGKLFHADSIPMTIIIDKQGVVQVVSIGFNDNLEQSLADEIEAVLAGKQLAKEALQEAREAQRGGKPIPAGEDAVTVREVAERQVAFNLRTSVEPYNTVGSRNKDWDDAAVKFLTEASRHFSSVEGCKTQAELVEMAEPLAEQGCDDPLVMYCHGAMLQDGVSDPASQAKAFELVERSYHGLVDRGYPANRTFAAAHRIFRTLTNDRAEPAKTEEYLALSEKHALESILQDDLQTDDGRTLYKHLNGFAESLPLERREQFCAAAQASAEKSPYVVNMLVGEYHIAAAWQARGGSFASEVSEEGWKGFGEHIGLARDAFEKAWKAAPKRPEAPTAMITVAMASSQSPEREMRRWFDRAVEAQLDYRPAYSNLMNGLLPRWHGSHEQMYQFGVECMETNRFDTDVPYEFCDAVWRIMQDNQNPLGKQYARRPGLYDNLQKVCQGYVAQGAARDAAWWKTVWLGFAYQAQQWDEAARLLNELDSTLDPDALSRFPLAADEVIQAVQLHASPHADAILAALAAADNGERSAAVDALNDLLEKEGLEPTITTLLASRLQGLNWNTDFENGEVVSLAPPADLQGWKVISGAWSGTPAGELAGESDRTGVILECQADFGTRWELTGEVEHGASPYRPWDAGILLNVDGNPQFSMMFNPGQSWVAAGPHDSLKRFRKPFACDGQTTKFVMRVDGDVVNVWLNDDLVIEDQEVPGLSDLTSSRVAIGAKYNWAGSHLTFRNLEIERLEPEK